MTRQLFTSLLLLAVPLAGCTVFQNVRRTVWGEPGEFDWQRDEARSRQLYLQWADQAWRTTGRPETRCDSPPYRAGFREGFADFVFGGGNGEPPLVPPREFWNADQRNGPGQRLADLWFAGYRHGAATAREVGYRDLVVLRSSLLTSVAPPGLPAATSIESDVERLSQPATGNSAPPKELQPEALEIAPLMIPPVETQSSVSPLEK